VVGLVISVFVINVRSEAPIVDFAELYVSAELGEELFKLSSGEYAFVVVGEEHVLGWQSLEESVKGFIGGRSQTEIRALGLGRAEAGDASRLEFREIPAGDGLEYVIVGRVLTMVVGRVNVNQRQIAGIEAIKEVWSIFAEGVMHLRRMIRRSGA
jgi:hypothetical protein